MDELEVESVDHLGVTDTAEYVLYGGKGGVGKTTMAAATAIASAADGVPTLVVSTDPAHSLSDAFGRDVPPDPETIHDQYPLYGAEIDPDAAMAESAVFQEGVEFGALSDFAEELAPDDHNGEGSVAGMPGADEAAAMQQLLRYLDDDRFERVVVDTAPTGHTLRLLELPDALDSTVGHLLSVRERIGDMLDGVTGLFGGDDAVDADDGFGDLRDLRKRIERLRTTLRDPARTDFRVVTVPEEMSVIEAKRLRDRLDEFEIPVGTIVVNRVMEPLADVSTLDVAVAEPDLDVCAFCQRRWDVQQRAIDEAQDLFRGHDVERVPLLAEEVRGESALRVVATCLSD